MTKGLGEKGSEVFWACYLHQVLGVSEIVWPEAPIKQHAQAAKTCHLMVVAEGQAAAEAFGANGFSTAERELLQKMTGAMQVPWEQVQLFLIPENLDSEAASDVREQILKLQPKGVLLLLGDDGKHDLLMQENTEWGALGRFAGIPWVATVRLRSLLTDVSQKRIAWVHAQRLMAALPPAPSRA